MRLGDWLAHQKGEVEMTKLGKEGVTRWGLEESFLKEEWRSALHIIKVMDPQCVARPFVVMWNNKAGDHMACTLSNKEVKEQYKEGKRAKIPGLSAKGNKAKEHAEVGLNSEIFFQYNEIFSNCV